jgi:GNAT superfamily N-acetyltransferase
MSVIVGEEAIGNLAQHATVPISFVVDRYVDVTVIEDGFKGLGLTEVIVDPPWVKNYDAVEGEGPTRWAEMFDTSNWGLIAAHEDGVRIGGAVVAFNTAGVNMLEGRSDLAVIWDIRVRSEARGRGVGRSIVAAVEEWARDRRCRSLKVETQNINVAACRFYQHLGFELEAIDRHAYVGFPEEAQLLWFKLGPA